MRSKENYADTARDELHLLLPDSFRTVLDVGCHSGIFIDGLSKRYAGLETWGIEPDPIAADIARNRCQHFFQGTIEEQITNLPKGHFDLICFNDVLEHIYDPSAVLRQIVELGLLTENGRIVACIPNVRYISNLYNLLFNKDWKYRESGVLDFTHIRFFTYKSMIRLFTDAGFEVERSEGIHRYGRKIPFAILNLATCFAFSDCEYLQYGFLARPQATS